MRLIQTFAFLLRADTKLEYAYESRCFVLNCPKATFGFFICSWNSFTSYWLLPRYVASSAKRMCLPKPSAKSASSVESAQVVRLRRVATISSVVCRLDQLIWVSDGVRRMTS